MVIHKRQWKSKIVILWDIYWSHFTLWIPAFSLTNHQKNIDSGGQHMTLTKFVTTSLYFSLFGLMVLKPLSKIFQFYWWRKLKKTTDLSQVTVNMKCCTPHPERDSNSLHQWWWALIVIRSRPWRLLQSYYRIPDTLLVPYRRKPNGTIVLGSIRLSVRHIKILSCPDFFFLTSFDILTWYLVCGYI